MRILVVGDSYMPVDVFRDGLADVAPAHEITYHQVDVTPGFEPHTESERSIREFAGSPRDLTAVMPGAEVLLIHGAGVTAEMLDAAPELRLVACARGGPINVDVAAATQRGVPVVTTPGKNADAVAELAIGFMLMLARGLPTAQAAAERATGASAFEGAEFFGHELAGRRLGLVGFGHVGRALAARATGLAMAVSAFDPYQPVDQAGVDVAEDLHALLAQADVVSLHARATPENENLMSGPEFAAMRAGSLFLNTARDSLVDEPALAAAVGSGHIAGAALDVVRSPADGHDPRLRTMRNVVITPHIGGATAETLQRGIAMLVLELGRLTRGEPLRNVANPTVVAA